MQARRALKEGGAGGWDRHLLPSRKTYGFFDLRVSGPRTIEVIPQEPTVGGYELPSFFTRSLAFGGRTLTLSELPLGAELVSMEPSEEDALVARAEKK